MNGLKGKIVYERDLGSEGRGPKALTSESLVRAYAYPSLQCEFLHLNGSAVKGSTRIKEKQGKFVQCHHLRLHSRTGHAALGVRQFEAPIASPNIDRWSPVTGHRSQVNPPPAHSEGSSNSHPTGGKFNRVMLFVDA
jgi:hypothetical protein